MGTSADVTASVTNAPKGFEFQSIKETRVYDIDVEILTGLKSDAAHNLITIPVGQVCVGGYVVALKSVVGTSSTITFDIAGTAVTGAVTEANMAKGDVITLAGNDIDGTAGIDVGWRHTAVEYVGMTVGTAVLTAGRLLFVLDFIHVDKIETNIADVA